jgi:hypothetical protein
MPNSKSGHSNGSIDQNQWRPLSFWRWAPDGLSLPHGWGPFLFAKSSTSRNSRSAWSQNSTAKHLILLGVVRASNPRVWSSEPLRGRQTVLPGSRSISRLPLILTRYGRKQGNGGTRNAGVIHAATWEPSRPLDGSFSLCRASARAGRPSADVETDKIRPRITSCQSPWFIFSDSGRAPWCRF